MEEKIYGYDESFNKVEVHPKAYTDQLAQDNLLINSDWISGLIDQKGFSSMGSIMNETGFPIDMWAITKMKLTSYDGYLKIENTDDTSHSFVQKFYEPFNGKYTFYANVKQASNGAYIWCYTDKDSANYERGENLNIGDNTWTFDGNIYCYGISIPAHGTVELYQCKLEDGSYFTGMPSWNKEEELKKCLSYFEIKYILGLAMAGTFEQFHSRTSTSYFYVTSTWTEKIKTPSIEVKTIWDNEKLFTEATATATNINEKKM